MGGHDIMDYKQLREEGYNVLSQLLVRPTEELGTLTRGVPFRMFWQRVNDQCGINTPGSWRQESLPSLEEWQSMWDVTMGPINPLAQPIESLYKEWTTDPSCEMIFAKDKGYIRGDWAYHMEELLGELGFEIPKEFHHCPDHLILIFELMSAMVESAPLEVQHQFASQHLDWLGDLVETAKERNVPAVYVDLYQWCKDFVEADLQYLSQQVK